MGLDIRKPIGLLLLAIGLQLALYGFLGDASSYTKSMGMNINLVWGAVLACVGGAFLVAGFWGSRKSG
ncbi:MAG: hypothetical protein JJE04_18900 [Acidobacteriia bacterium]|nr:hypothetical protein [Terriglobia bacterium]